MAAGRTLFTPLRLMRGGNKKCREEPSGPPPRRGSFGGRNGDLRRWPSRQRTVGQPHRPSGRSLPVLVVVSLGLSLVAVLSCQLMMLLRIHDGVGDEGGGGVGGVGGQIGVENLIRRRGVGDVPRGKREEDRARKREKRRIQRRHVDELKEKHRSEDYPMLQTERVLTDEQIQRADNLTLPRPALLILAYNRPTYLKQQLERLHHLPRRSNFAVYVSQDGNETSAAEVRWLCGDGKKGIGICPVRTACCSKYGWCGTTESHCGRGDRPCGDGKVGNGVCPGAEENGVCCSRSGWCGTTEEHCRDQMENVGTVADVVRSKSDFVTHLVHPRVSLPDQPGTAYLARHYKWALDQMFVVRNHSHVVVAEDDLLFAPDFLRLFEQSGYLLDVDPTLWCVSSWNDLGPHRFATDPRALRRTDYFPGLGWMLTRRLWVEELSDRFPMDAWDHWMRLDTVSRGRSCVYPEVSRNFNIGSGAGTTVEGEFFHKYIRPNRVAKMDVVDFGDLDYLLKDNYDRMLTDMIERAVVVEGPTAEEIQGWVAPPRNVSAGSNANATDAAPGAGGVKDEEEELVRFVPYTTETYGDVVAKPLHIIPTPRTRYRGVTVLHVSPRGHLLLGDVRAVDDNGDGSSSSSSLSLIPSALRFKVDPGFRAVPGRVGESCYDACRGHVGTADLDGRSNGTFQELRCSDDHFAFVNKCSTLMKHFPCEKGCWGSVIGPDVPNYVPAAPIDSYGTNTTMGVGKKTKTAGRRGVDGRAKGMAGYCLTTEGVPKCNASHVSTARICPCLPVTLVVPVPA